ncbi:MAG: DUF3488 domain-containing protein [Bdellovibrionaceae bacterium]|nr:DUF3488 domain-containing protein [Pseudobdellovibrionaceae bacterium]
MTPSVRAEKRLLRILSLFLVALLLGEIPWIFVGLAMLGLIVSVLIADGWVRPLPRFLTSGAAVLAGVVIYATSDTMIGREPSAALLAVLASLKALEARGPQDERVLALIGLFLLAVVDLFQANLWTTLVSVLATAGYLWLLLRWAPVGLSRRRAMSVLGRLSLRALPVAMLLFLLVPRLQHEGLWGAASAGPTGFSEELIPSAVESIQPDETPVLRALWSYGYPEKPLYWRGSVLEEPQGFSWFVRPLARQRALDLKPLRFPRSNLSRVEWILEPDTGRWTFAPVGSLDVNEKEFNRALEGDPETGLWKLAARSRARTHLVAAVSEAPPVSVDARPDLQEMPPLSEETRQWLQSALTGTKSRLEKMRRLRRVFFDQGFLYSRKPGKLQDLDAFLKAKKGYCEHYASALALLGRAAGVPTRVVVGYMGGSYNPVGEFILVTKSQAHAWVEYLDDDNAWRASDATAGLAVEDALRDRPPARPTSWEEAGWFDRLHWGLESLNYEVAVFFMSFDLSRQVLLWNALREAGPGALAALFLVLLAAVMTSFGRRGWRSLLPSLEPREVRRYRRWVQKESRLGSEVSFIKGPLENLESVEKKDKERAEAARSIVDDYIRFRF